MLYAAYGSNLNIEQMAKRCPKAKISGVGYVEGYILTFQGKKSCAYCNIIRDNSNLAIKSIVPILLWDITPTDEKSLDRYEGYPKFYVKKEISVHRSDNGAVVKATAYVMNGNPSLGYPSPEYFYTVYKGYYENKIQPEILFRAAAETARIIKANGG